MDSKTLPTAIEQRADEHRGIQYALTDVNSQSIAFSHGPWR